jgi:peptide/nickel transport system permease protein
LTPHDPEQPIADPLQGASRTMPLGADTLGRDNLSRLLFGARRSLGGAGLATGLSALSGGLAGLIAAGLGGFWDRSIRTLSNILLAVPGLLLALIMMTAFGPGLTTIILAVGIGGAPGFARLSRSIAVQILSQPYIQAAVALGAGRSWILRRHVIPNARRPLLALVSTYFAWGLLGLTTLSFLGLAGDPSIPEWGLMLNEGRNYLVAAPGQAMIPGLAISLTILAVHRLADWFD